MMCKLLQLCLPYFLPSLKYSLHFKGGQYVNEFKIKTGYGITNTMANFFKPHLTLSFFIIKHPHPPQRRGLGAVTQIVGVRIKLHGVITLCPCYGCSTTNTRPLHFIKGCVSQVSGRCGRGRGCSIMQSNLSWLHIKNSFLIFIHFPPIFFILCASQKPLSSQPPATIPPCLSLFPSCNTSSNKPPVPSTLSSFFQPHFHHHSNFFYYTFSELCC